MKLTGEQMALLRELSHCWRGKHGRDFEGLGTHYFAPIPRYVRALELAGYLRRTSDTTNGTGPNAAWFAPTWAGRLAASPVVMDPAGRLASQAGAPDLHEFCDCHGISRALFRDHGPAARHPHYQLPSYRAAQWALYNGARLVSAREFFKSTEG